MNNILFVVIDSMSNERLQNYNQNISLTPFLDSIQDECITADSMYSQGPYTEAGTRGLLCCCDTLDGDNYYYRYDDRDKFVTDIFKDLGYEIYDINAPSYLLSKRELDNIDHMIYTSGYDVRFLWSQRFEFYYDRWKNGNFVDEDYDILGRFVQLVFESAEDFYNNENAEEKYSMIRPLIKGNVLQKGMELLEQQRKEFEADKRAYIDSIFMQQMNHPIFTLQNIDMDGLINTPGVNKAMDHHKDVSKKIRRIQFYSNLKNNHCAPGALVRSIKGLWRDKKITKSNLGEIGNRVRNLVSGRELEVYRCGRYYRNDPYKLTPCTGTQLQYAAKIINDSEENGKFIFVHTEEPHYFNTFFSYDSRDDDLIDSEFAEADEFLNQLNGKFKGSVYYDLSVRYVDKQIKQLYKSLEQSGKLKDTLVVITADHGSSYFFDPIRPTLVNNFHAENYHIPLYIFGNGVQGKNYTEMYHSKDIIPTIAELSGRKLEGDFSGRSILDATYKSDSIMIEYMGPGCPDIRMKPVWLSARSRNYVVSYIGLLKDEFNENNITEIYDLIRDPAEIKNFRDLRNPEICDLIEMLKKRVNKLRREHHYA